MTGRLRALAACAVAACALAAGCTDDGGRFPLVVSTMTDDGQPLPGLDVRVGRTAAGKTDAEGKLRIRVLGKEGARVTVTAATPKGYRLASTSNVVVLRRLTGVEGGGRPLPIEHVIRFAPLERRYAVLVRAGVAGLPVEAFGTRQAVTNDQGVAIFLYEGAPGDELQVKLVTDGHPELRPQNPTQSFLLAQRSEAYLVKQHFETVRKAHKHRPTHVGPKRL